MKLESVVIKSEVFDRMLRFYTMPFVYAQVSSDVDEIVTELIELHCLNLGVRQYFKITD